MFVTPAPTTGRMAAVTAIVGWLAMAASATAQDRPSVVAASKADVIAMTPQWKGERTADGRPKVSDDLLKRMRGVASENAWEILRNHGYDNQFDGRWKILNPDEAFVGRALTAAYIPSRPDLQEHITRGGQSEGRIGRPNSWPIDMLQKGDVYVADGFGKVIDGTLMGDNLGNSIFAKTGTGVVFDAAARDLEGLRRIKGFNALVREWDPSEIKGMLLSSINKPIRIGRAVVMPGDVVLARRIGVVFIPAHLAEEVVSIGEIIAIKDEFGHMRLREGKYTPGQIDSRWTDAIKADFFEWYKQRKNNPPITLAELEKHL
jgi:4-hydroxy-4-methyl-2-oxoglutarate aldolase